MYNNIPIDEKTLNRILPIFFPKEEDYQRNNRRDTVIFLVYSATDLIFSYYSREMREGKGEESAHFDKFTSSELSGQTENIDGVPDISHLSMVRWGVKIWER